MESRLAQLESKLGAAAVAPPVPTGARSDVNSRIDKLMRQDRRVPPTAFRTAPGSKSSSAAAGADSKRSALHEELLAIDRLMSEMAMSPVAGPTASAAGGPSNNAPMAFRRMEVLAGAESMKRDMDLLARIRDLTLIGTRASAGGNEDVVNCPIVSSERYNFPSDPEAAERLDRLCLRVARLNQRAAMASQRADKMLNAYGKIMMALSEKMVLAEEQILG